MTNASTRPTTSQARALLAEEIDQVSGGMKWVRGTSNSDVIDARGGSLTIFCFRVTLDVNGKVSSVEHV